MADADDTRSGSLHGVLVWCIGLIAGALFLAGTMATGAMSAGTAASGNAGAVQRATGETGRVTTTPGRQARADQAAKGAAEGAGGGALAAIAGLLGGIVGAAISVRRERGATMRRRWTSFRHDETRAGAAHAGDRGFGTTYGSERAAGDVDGPAAGGGDPALRPVPPLSRTAARGSGGTRRRRAPSLGVFG